MNFERGKDPMEAMGLGIIETAIEFLSGCWGQYADGMYSKKGKDLLKKDFIETIGTPLGIRRRGNTFFFYIEGRKKNIKLSIDWTIQRVTDNTGPR